MQAKMFFRDLGFDERKLVWRLHLIGDTTVIGMIRDVSYMSSGDPFTILIQPMQVDATPVEVPWRAVIYVQQVV